jgi:hypothetical protein
MSMSPSLPPEVPMRSLTPVLVALALGLVAIGLLVWKLTGSASDSVQTLPGKEGAGIEVPPPSKSAPADTSQPPPPPPPAEEVAARPVRGGLAVPELPSQSPELAPKVPPPGRDCQAPCAGAETPELLRALRASAARARSCYEKALANDSALAGRLEVAVRVSPTGSVCSASIGKDGLGNAAVATCVLSRVRGGAYPAPTGGCVDVLVPLNFMPQGLR